MTNEITLRNSAVINACFPRSGHRFLRQLLAQVFKSEFNFASYNPDSTTLQINNQQQLQSANYIKAHDFLLQGPDLLKDTISSQRLYLVQIRHPLMSIMSYYEFALRHNHIAEDNKESWLAFLQTRLDYWKQFADLWLRNSQIPEQLHLLVTYEALIENTEQVLSKATEFLVGDKVSPDNIKDAIEKVPFLQYNNDKSSQKKQVRTPQQFRYFDQVQFAEIEQQLTDEYLSPIALKPQFS